MSEPAPPASEERNPDEKWRFEEGEEIVPGRYALERLGGGWDFEAYVAWDDRLYSLVVVKLVRPHLVEEPRTLRHLSQEAGLLLSLAHPMVVRGFDAVLEGARPHLAMEHLEGPTLADTIKHFGPLDPAQLLPLAFQIASAAQYLANREIVHLDIKPRNIILGVPPRLIDLSVARSLERAGRITTPVGTDAYMAPEQCDPSLAEIGTSADVWGLGATLFHAVAGEVPFPRPKEHDDDPRQRWPQTHAHPQDLPSHTAPELEGLILDCLAFEPAERPTPAGLAQRLEPLIGAIKRGRILGRGRPKIL